MSSSRAPSRQVSSFVAPRGASVSGDYGQSRSIDMDDSFARDLARINAFSSQFHRARTPAMGPPPPPSYMAPRGCAPALNTSSSLSLLTRHSGACAAPSTSSSAAPQPRRPLTSSTAASMLAHLASSLAVDGNADEGSARSRDSDGTGDGSRYDGGQGDGPVFALSPPRGRHPHGHGHGHSHGYAHGGYGTDSSSGSSNSSSERSVTGGALALMRRYPYGRVPSAAASGARPRSAAHADAGVPAPGAPAPPGTFRSKLGVLPYRLLSVTSQRPSAPASSLLSRDAGTHWTAHTGANHELTLELARPALVGYLQLSNRTVSALEVSVSYRGVAADDWVAVARDDRVPRGKVSSFNTAFLPARYVRVRFLRGAPVSASWLELLGVPLHLAETVIGEGAEDLLVARPLHQLMLPPQPVLRADRRHRQPPYPLGQIPKPRPAGAAELWEQEPHRTDGAVCLH